MNVTDFHSLLDENADGMVTKSEFVKKMSQLRIAKVENSELGDVFDKLDWLQDRKISLKELTTFLEAVKVLRMEKLAEIDPSMKKLINEEVDTFFGIFDIDGDGAVS